MSKTEKLGNSDNSHRTEIKILNEQSKAGEIGAYLLKNFNFMCPRDSDELHVYEDGVYTPNIDVVNEMIKQILGKKKWTSHKWSEIMKYIKQGSYVNREEIDEVEVLNMKNGLYNTKTHLFTPHTPKYISINRFDLAYDSTATCPRFEQFIDEIVEGGDKIALEDMIGYTFHDGYPYHVVYLLVGKGNNGKGALLRLLQTLHGWNGIESISLIGLTRPFAMSELYGKRVNMCGDIGSKPVDDEGIIKTLSGGDPISTNVKNQQKMLKFINSAKFIFSANSAPKATGGDTRYMERWEIITFPNAFDDDPDLDDILESERAGIFNLAMTYLERIRKNRGVSRGNQNQVRKYRLESVPEEVFIEECIESNPGRTIELGLLYGKLLEFCVEERVSKSVTKITLGKLMMKKYDYSKEKNGNTWVWANVTFT